MDEYRYIELIYNKNNPSYQRFMEQMEREYIRNGLRSRNVEIRPVNTYDPMEFVLNLKDYDGNINLTLEEFDDNTFELIFNEIDKNNQEPKQGGSKYYNSYTKYKKQYIKLKNKLSNIYK